MYDQMMKAEQAQPDRFRTATEVRDTPRLFQQCEQMAKMLHVMSEQARRLEQAANRLTNPRPQAIEKGHPEDTSKPSTVEQQYAMLIGYAEKLHLRLSEVASHLESAV